MDSLCESFFEEEITVDQELCKALSEGANLTRHIDYGSQKSLNKRSMVLDEESFEQTFLVCPVCCEAFGSPHRVPKLLPCHHSFCLPCIRQLFLTEVEHRQSLIQNIRTPPTTVSIHCPTCRGSFITTDENVRALPTDHRVVQLLEFVSNTEKYTVSFCSKHNLQALNFFCEPCVLPLCRDCTVLDHKEQDGHVVMDLNEALEKYTPVLDKAITEMEAEIEVLDGKQEKLDSATQRLEDIRSDLLKNIHVTFERLREQLAERERELVSIAENEVNKEKKRLDEKNEELTSRRKALKENTATLKQAKDESSIEDMFSAHQNVQGYKNLPPIKIREVDDGLQATFAFNAVDESLIRNRICNFGDVSSKVETTYKTSSSYRYAAPRSGYR